MDSPPKIAIASIGSRVEVEVFTVRVRVAFSDLFAVTLKSSLGCRPRFSLIRSKITTTSLIAYPMMVRMAAMKAYHDDGRVGQGDYASETPGPSLEPHGYVGEDYEQRENH